MTYSRRQPGAFHREMRFDRMAVSMLRAYFFGTGPGTVVPGGLHAFIKTRPELAVPDIEFMFRGAPHHPHLWFPMLRAPYQDGYGIRPTLLHPDSRGEVLLRSADPRDPPRIAINFFSAPNDLPTLARRASSSRARSPIKSRSTPIAGARPMPGDKVKTDAEIDALDPQHGHHRASSLRHLRDGRRRPTPCSIRRCGCAASSGCAWSTPRQCPTWSPRTSTPAC